MRYPDSGGLSDEGRAKRETVRLQAAEWFAQDVPVAEIARRCTCGAERGVRKDLLGWHRKDLADRRADWMINGWRGWRRHWRKAPPRTGSMRTNAGPCPGSVI
jgi:hypothetical protein